MRIFGFAVLACCVGLAAYANAPSPYAGEQARAIKALSAQEIEDLQAGRGMGLAKAGELNSYPGPLHVLALKVELALEPQQVAATQALFDAMQADAKTLGAQIIALEQQLDQGFASGTIDQASLDDLTARIALLQGRLRAVHLQAHLATKRLLSAQQVASYDRLRGYDANAPGPATPHGGHKH